MLSSRLQKVAVFVDNKDKIIDIGCDHALLDIYLVENKSIDKMIVSDIHEGALNQGISNIKNKHLEEKIETRLGNGLEVLNQDDDVDTIIISGMGTSTILDILDNKYLKNIKKIIIQSNNDHELLRSEVVKLGYKITDEDYLVDANKHYIIIVFEKGNEKYTKVDLKYGPFLKTRPDYLEYEYNNLNKIYNLVPSNKILLRNKIKKELNIIKKLNK